MKSLTLLLSFLLMLPATVFAASVEEGETIFKTRCNLCHQYPDRDLLKPDQWPHLLDLKQKLMKKAGMLPLTPEEYESVLLYVTAPKVGSSATATVR